MAAGGYKEFVAGETLDQDEINDFLMQGMLVFAGTAARGSAITAPVEGQFSFLADSDSVEFYDGSQWTALASESPAFDYLVVGGGGGAQGATLNYESSGGGGAGGYRTSTGTSGGTSASGTALRFSPGSSFTVTVGAGGAGVGARTTGNRGGHSQFADVYANGGGASFGNNTATVSNTKSGASGAGGNGSGAFQASGLGSPLQGFNGGIGSAYTGGSIQGSGGGGGAGAVGAASSGGTGGNGGVGLASSITGSSVTRAGGGGGGGSPAGSGGTGGGGNGGNNAVGSNGSANTGGGGGGASTTTSVPNRFGGSGGSGVVIIKYPDSITLTIGAGLTSSTSTAGGFKTTTFTAGTDTVSF